MKPPTLEQVLAVVDEHQPITASDVTGHMMRSGHAEWSMRTTIRNRLNELAELGRVITDDVSPACRYAVNMLHDCDGCGADLGGTGAALCRECAL